MVGCISLKWRLYNERHFESIRNGNKYSELLSYLLEADWWRFFVIKQISTKLDKLVEQRHLWLLFMIHVDSGAGYTILTSGSDVNATVKLVLVVYHCIFTTGLSVFQFISCLEYDHYRVPSDALQLLLSGTSQMPSRSRP